MLRFRFSLRMLLLLLTVASLYAGWKYNRTEMQRLAGLKAYRQRLVSRLEWMEEDRCRLYAELQTLSGHPLSKTPFKMPYHARESKESELYKLSVYMDGMKKELDDVR